jgi:2,3-bisphosphoglycerate-independent phosphoglycerate mutase
MIPGPVTLLILDGVGDGARDAHDATFVSGMPNLNALRRAYPATQLCTSEERVGLPEGQFGNSEVGHMNLGAGRVVWQELTRIDSAIKRGTFRENGPMAAFLADLRARGARLHLIGLLSPGGVHSHQNHLVALAQWVQDLGLPTTIHALLDGRDTPQKSADGYLAWLEERLKATPLVQVGSIGGRYWAMDRDQRWERVEAAWKLLVDGETEFRFPDSAAAIAAAYARGETDEFVKPTALDAMHPFQDGDGVLCFNFRGDRARQFCQALVQPGFNGFTPRHRPAVKLLTFTEYEAGLNPYLSMAYPPQDLARILGELVSLEGWRQLRTAETEKYAHVTFFFNGGREEPFPGEERRLVPSPKVATYDLQPEMSCPEVARGLVAAIRGGEYRLLVCNLANGDMVGHSGYLSAAVSALGAVDDAVRLVAQEVLARNGALLITADHGNSEQMLDEEGHPHTAHTMNPVPCVLVAKGLEGRRLRSGGALCDVAPTILELLGMPQPPEMDGKSLLV